MNTWVRRFSASALTALILVLSPGLPFYEVWGAVCKNGGGAEKSNAQIFGNLKIGEIALPLTNSGIAGDPTVVPILPNIGSDAERIAPGAKSIVPILQLQTDGRTNPNSSGDAIGAPNGSESTAFEPSLIAGGKPQNEKTDPLRETLPAISKELGTQGADKSGILSKVFDFFGKKKAGPKDSAALPVSAQPAASDFKSLALTPPQDESKSSEGGSDIPPPNPAKDSASQRRMMSAYIGAGNFSQAGYEMLSSGSMPMYLQKTFGNMAYMADLSILGSLASVIGRQLSPLVINRFTLKASYLGLLGATFVAALAIGGIANFGIMTIPILFVLMAVFRSMQAASSTAERAVIPSVLGKDQVAIEDLRGRKQSWAEVASVLVQNGAAALVLILGTATTNLIIAPWFYLIALALIWFTLKVPRDADQMRLTGWRETMGIMGGGLFGTATTVLKSFGRQIGLGYKVVMNDPVLRASAMVSILITMFNVSVYALMAPLFGVFAIGPDADSNLAAPIMGLIAGLFSFGGLFAGKFVNQQAREIEEKYANDIQAGAEVARQSTMRWLKFGGLSFLAVGMMALPLPAIGPLFSPEAIDALTKSLLGFSVANLFVAAVLGVGTVLAMWRPKLGLAVAIVPILVAFPVHVVLTALAFFGFGIVQVIASLKNDSFQDRVIQEKAPADYANAASFVMAASMFAGMLGLIALKFLFYGKLPFGIPSPTPGFIGLPGIWPFVVLFLALAVPTMLSMLYIAKRLDQFTKPPSSETTSK